jgi:hypothetical protein
LKTGRGLVGRKPIDNRRYGRLTVCATRGGKGGAWIVHAAVVGEPEFAGFEFFVNGVAAGIFFGGNVEGFADASGNGFVIVPIFGERAEVIFAGRVRRVG